MFNQKALFIKYIVTSIQSINEDANLRFYKYFTIDVTIYISISYPPRIARQCVNKYFA